MTKENLQAADIRTFDYALARDFGLEEAVFVMHLQRSIEEALQLKKSNANLIELVIKDGLVWKPWTVAQLSQELQFWTPKQIRRVKDSCIEQGIVRADFLDIHPMDRRLWYAVTV